MRELKFRVWDEKHKRWEKVLSGCIAKSNEQFIYLGNALHRARFVIEQYTGLKDKNGKEIYEGDIVGCDYCCESHVISWCDNAACFEAWQNDDAPCLMLGESHEQLHYRVIGNIHENYELVDSYNVGKPTEEEVEKQLKRYGVEE